MRDEKDELPKNATTLVVLYMENQNFMKNRKRKGNLKEISERDILSVQIPDQMCCYMFASIELLVQ